MHQVLDVLRVAGLVLAGLTVYTLVTLAVVAALGFRYQQFKQRRRVQSAPPTDLTNAEELVAA